MLSQPFAHLVVIDEIFATLIILWSQMCRSLRKASVITTNSRMFAINDHYCHNFDCVAGSFITIAILIWYCNSLVDGCDNPSILQRICFVVCISYLCCKKVVHIATKNKSLQSKVLEHNA